jgi:uncharacterized phage protein (TIGR02220 family)
MALRDQPYLPLYVQDFLTDEKLALCSAETTGVYIRLMCILHKSKNYGEITLISRDKANKNQIENFALILLKLMPYEYSVILDSLNELIDRGVVYIDGDTLIQKRMQKDGKISEVRSLAGSMGGRPAKNKKAKIKQNQSKTESKIKANTEYEYEYEYEYEDAIVNDDEDTKYENIYKAVIEHLNEKAGTSYKHTSKVTQTLIRSRQIEGYTLPDFKKVIDNRCCEWLGDNKMSQFLRPSTLFGTKFESYLNKPKDPNKSYDTDEFFEAALKRSYERTS